MADPLSDEHLSQMRALARERVSKKRFQHMEGVAETAQLLARTYGQDEKKARLAGILHDWDKGLDNDEIRAKARDLGLDEVLGEWMIMNMPQVLHGPTAAEGFRRTDPDIPEDVLSAIYKHTIAAKEMSPLDKIIYIADAIEPNRSFAEAEGLRELIGKVSLDELYFQVYKFWIEALISKDGLLHPDTLAIWNDMTFPKAHAHLQRYEKRCKEKKA